MSVVADSVALVQSDAVGTGRFGHTARSRDALAGHGRYGLVGQVLDDAIASLSSVAGSFGPGSDDTVFGGPQSTGLQSSGLQSSGLQSSASQSSASQSSGGKPSVLDCGGGSGSFAVPLARAGATVTVVDISADALATLRRRAAEAGIADRVHAVQGDIESLADVVGVRTFDVVLAHGVLEAVDELGPVFAQLARTVRPGGLLSVLIGNPVAVVLARALAGELAAARDELALLDDLALDPAAIRALCTEHGFDVEQAHGIGVFTDLVPGAALDAPGAREELVALEAACATRSPFADIAVRVHLLARRVAG